MHIYVQKHVKIVRYKCTPTFNRQSFLLGPVIVRKLRFPRQLVPGNLHILILNRILVLLAMQVHQKVLRGLRKRIADPAPVQFWIVMNIVKLGLGRTRTP